MKTMNPSRFVLGERVLYRNHVTGAILGYLEIVTVGDDFITAKRFFGKTADFKFHSDGRATWSSNLCIEHE